MDHEVGRLLAELDRQGLTDSTAVIFTSDNGPETLNRYRGAQRSYGSPGELRGMKLHLYEGGTRVPGIVRWPGVTRAGTVSAEPVSGVDLLPTLAKAAGVRPPEGWRLDGTNALAAFRGGKVKRETPLFWIYQRALGGPKAAIQQGDWKLLTYPDGRPPELYNLSEDHRETREVASAHPGRVRTLSRRLDALLADLPEPPSRR